MTLFLCNHMFTIHCFDLDAYSHPRDMTVPMRNSAIFLSKFLKPYSRPLPSYEISVEYEQFCSLDLYRTYIKISRESHAHNVFYLL